MQSLFWIELTLCLIYKGFLVSIFWNIYTEGILQNYKWVLNSNIGEEYFANDRIINLDTREKSENYIKIAVGTINEFTEDMTLEILNTELNRRFMISSEDEFIQSDESTRDNTHKLFRVLRQS